MANLITCHHWCLLDAQGDQESVLASWGPMAAPTAAVQRALQLAAGRAARHAMLDSALTTMARLLNYPLEPEMLPWGAAMSTSYLLKLELTS